MLTPATPTPAMPTPAMYCSLLVAALLVIAGCSSTDGPAAPDPNPSAPTTTAPDVVSTADPVMPTAPVDDGWISLFNGADLTGWTPKIVGQELGADPYDTFRVEDGALVVSYDAYETFDGRFGHIFHETEFDRYVLRLEYRFTGDATPGAPGWAFRNSGVMVHGQPADTMRVDQSFPVSIEVQLLGGDGTHPRPTGNLCTPGTHVSMDGELVRRHCTNSSSDTYHGDQWVEMEIEVLGHLAIRHWINGELVLEYAEPILDDGDADANAWMDRRGGDPKLHGGTISLQAEGHPCAFRNIRIRRLDP